MSLSKTLTALSGEYLVAAQLCMRGTVASLTLKNYPGVDIFAYNPQNGKQAAIQVKTTRVSRTQGYFTSDPSKVARQGTPFVFMYLGRQSPPEFYIIGASDLASLIQEEGTYCWVSLQNLQNYKDQWSNLSIF